MPSHKNTRRRITRTLVYKTRIPISRSVFKFFLPQPHHEYNVDKSSIKTWTLLWNKTLLRHIWKGISYCAMQRKSTIKSFANLRVENPLYVTKSNILGRIMQYRGVINSIKKQAKKKYYRIIAIMRNNYYLCIKEKEGWTFWLK